MTERDGENVPRRAPEHGASLVSRVATRLCALPVGAVIETMRRLPVEPIAGAPAFIAGLAIVRGEPGALAGDVVAAVGALDARLLIVLETARLVPPAVFELLERPAP